LIDLSAFAAPREVPPLDPADARLISGASKIEVSTKISTTAYPWLRKPQYMTNEPTRERVLASKEDKSMNETLTVDEIEMTSNVTSDEYRLKKVDEVLKTFEDAKTSSCSPDQSKTYTSFYFAFTS